MGIYYMGIYIYMWEYIDGNINYMDTAVFLGLYMGIYGKQ